MTTLPEPVASRTEHTTRPSAEPGWRRLSGRVVWVDLAVALLSLVPGLVGLWLAPSAGALAPLVALTVAGVAGAVADTLRWLSTTYRVTGTEVQRRSGIVFRRSRSVRLDRIRSVDTSARLRHRLAGMRVVTVCAGQQTSTGEAAFRLDALTREDAAALREQLLGIAQEPSRRPDPGPAQADDEPTSDDTTTHDPARTEVEVLERFRFRWTLYNVFTLWAFLMAAGVLWALHWLLATFGVDLWGTVKGLLADLGFGWFGTAVVVLVAGGTFGAVALGVSFVLSNWDFELARVRSPQGSFLRTRRGYFTTREVNRDEARVRGITVDEPLVWRWMRMADTNVLTTGLSLGSTEEATTLVPRGPLSVAHRVAGRVVGQAFAASATLPRHPDAALRRRLWWATGTAAGLLALVAVPVGRGLVPLGLLWIVPGVWLVALAGAVVAHRALGHGVHGDHVVVRAGLVNRSTTVLRRDAVSTVAVRQSILQRRLGLATVTVMSAAGWGAYEAPDVAADEAFGFACAAAPGILDPFLEPRGARPR